QQFSHHIGNSESAVRFGDSQLMGFSSVISAYDSLTKESIRDVECSCRNCVARITWLSSGAASMEAVSYGKVIKGHFSSAPPERWFISNLPATRPRPGELAWALIFGVGCWLLWSWCNKALIDPQFIWPPEGAGVIFRVANSFFNGLSGLTSQEQQARAWNLVRRRPPKNGWVKLNTNGSSRGNPGLAVVGGFITRCVGCVAGRIRS
ncbi:hypothetical protein CRG98_016117, partial [Punica granatum]